LTGGSQNTSWLGQKKLVKNNEANQIQNITLCNTYETAYNWVWSEAYLPQKLGNFCVKSNLTVCKVTCNCKLQKKLGKPEYVDKNKNIKSQDVAQSQGGLRDALYISNSRK